MSKTRRKRPLGHPNRTATFVVVQAAAIRNADTALLR